MLQRWHHAPRWVVSIVTGAVFTVLFGTLNWIVGGGSLLGVVVGAVVAGVIFGALMGPVVVRNRPRWSAGATTTTAAQHRAGVRAARGGPVPDDPVSRAIAVDVVRLRLDRVRRGRRLWLASFSGAVVLYLLLALVVSPWWGLGAALFATLLALAVREDVPRLSRRLEQLTAVG